MKITKYNLNTSYSKKKLELNNFLNDFNSGLNSLICNESIKNVNSLHYLLKDKDTFIHTGIGGSSLGVKAFYEVKNPRDKNIFFLDNLDSRLSNEIFKKISLNRTLFYVVSKSGKTTETLRHLASIVSFLKNNNIPPTDFNKYVVICSENVDNPLTKFAEEFDIKSLFIPKNIGGRYSVLTPVGLFPLLFLGVDLQSIEKEYRETLFDEDIMRIAEDIFYQYSEGVTQTVLMPYTSYLDYFTLWFVQLWSESLGKKEKSLTAIPSKGANDQHSQLQLFAEGKKDKFFFFISFKNSENDHVYGEDNLFQGLGRIPLNMLLNFELQATIKSLKEKRCPIVHIELERLNLFSLIKLIKIFQFLTVKVGQLLEINPFDQPGVERSKEITKELIKKYAQKKK